MIKRGLRVSGIVNKEYQTNTAQKKLTKAKIGEVGGNLLNFPINPTQYSEQSTTQYSMTGGFGNFPYPQFTQAELPVISVNNIYLTKVEGHDVDGFIKHLQKLQVKRRRSSFFNYPPDVEFIYGGDVKVCKLTELTVNKIRFDSKLNCTEARIDIVLVQVDF
jgi:hypothetical protein